MKRFLIIIGLIILMVSCNDNQTNPTTSEIESYIKIDTLGNNKIEKNLKNQLIEYYTAYTEGNADKAMKYCYPDMFVWMKQKYPERFTIDMAKKAFKESIKDLEKKLKENKMIYGFEIGKITQKIDLGSRKLFTIVLSITLKKGFKEYKDGSEIIAITIDNGKNWKFMEKETKTTPKILKMKFSDKVVNELMGKN